MAENKLEGNQSTKDHDEIQFVPNMSSLQGSGLQLWMNALHSSKDVHCNLTSENGLLKITLIDPIDKCESVDTKVSNLQNNNQSDPSFHFECENYEYQRNSVLRSCSKSKNQTSFESKKALISKCEETVDSAHSTVIVTVSPEKPKKPEVSNFSPKYIPPDPKIFPCTRTEWFQNTPGEELSLFDEIGDVLPDNSTCINTTVLAGDLRMFLKHHSIPLGTFSKNYLKRSQGTLSDLLNHPKPWICLSSRGRSIYTKMMKFLSSKDLLLTVEKYKQSSDAGRRGPPTDSLPSRLMKLLADKKMPSSDYLRQVSSAHQLGVVQLRAYCQSQLKHDADSFNVVVEFEDKQSDPNEGDESNFAGQREEKEVVMKSGFEPRSFDKHICPVHGCGLILGARLTLKHHLLTHSGQRPHRCPKCDQTFVTLNNLRKHEQRHEREQKVSKRARRAAILNDKASSAVSKLNLNRDEQSQDEDVAFIFDEPKTNLNSKRRTYVCCACSMTFESKNLLRGHVIDEHANEVLRDNCRLYACRLCQKLFKTIGSVHVHQKSHAKGRTFECHHCKKRFFTSYNCKRHMRSHTDAKPFFCPRCPARFAESKNLTNHMRLHTGDRPYQCKVCKKCFTQQSSLQSHLLLHSDSRPFLCAICGKGFRQRSNLRVHEDRHHSKCTFVCRICAMAFASSSDYHRHSRTHNSERRFVCNKCSMSYSRFSYLTQHVQKAHSLSPFKCDKCECEISTKTAFLNHQCVPVGSRSESENGKEADVQLFETVPGDSNLSSTILQVFPNAVCCISPLPNREPELANESLAQEVTSFNDPSLVAPNQSTSFPLHNSSVPVAIVQNDVFVLTSPTEVDSSVIVERNEAIPNESVFGSLSKLPLTSGKVLCATMQDNNDPNMHSVIVAPEEYERLQDGASYVMVNVADEVTVLNTNLPS